MAKRATISQRKAEMISKMGYRLQTELDPTKDPRQIARDRNKIIRECLEEGGVGVVFFGQYLVDPKSVKPGKRLDEGQVVLYESTAMGCSPIPSDAKISIIARSAINGEFQWIPDVSKDPSHWECDPDSRFEIVNPIFKKNRDGIYVFVGADDMDANRIYAMNELESRAFGDVIRPSAQLIIPRGLEVKVDHRNLIYRSPNPPSSLVEAYNSRKAS